MIAFSKPVSLDALIAEAANLYRELVESEKRTVVNYWQLGEASEIGSAPSMSPTG